MKDEFYKKKTNLLGKWVERNSEWQWCGEGMMDRLH